MANNLTRNASISKLSASVWISKSVRGSVASTAGSATSDESYITIKNIKWIQSKIKNYKSTKNTFYTYIQVTW